MWFYIFFDFDLAINLFNLSYRDSVSLFWPIGSYVFKHDYSAKKFINHIKKEIYIKFGKIIIEKGIIDSQLDSLFKIRSANVVYDNFATLNNFNKMFNFNRSLLCQEEEKKEFLDVAPDVFLEAVSVVN